MQPDLSVSDSATRLSENEHSRTSSIDRKPITTTSSIWHTSCTRTSDSDENHNPGPEIRLPRTRQKSRLYGNGNLYRSARRRREHSHIQRGESGAAQSITVPPARSPGYAGRDWLRFNPAGHSRLHHHLRFEGPQ